MDRKNLCLHEVLKFKYQDFRQTHLISSLEPTLAIISIVHFSEENRPSFYIVNLGTYFSIFHNSRNLASFSLQFWIIKKILQPLITYGIITIIKIKIPLFV